MTNLIVGQILWLKLPFINGGPASTCEHPYIIIELDDTYNTIEVAQIDSIKGKDHKLIYKSNKPIFITDPSEPALSEDSFMQMDHLIRLQYFRDITAFRKCETPISDARLKDLLDSYHRYHNENIIPDKNILYIVMDELLLMNADIST